MSFGDYLAGLELNALVERATRSTQADVTQALAAPKLALTEFASLISHVAGGELEILCRRSQDLTRRRFGKVIRLFAPLYLSNECINNCTYCGFSRDNPIVRVTLTVPEVVREARALVDDGFRNLLLVAGEHPKFVAAGYLAKCVAALHEFIPSLSLELGPMSTAEYEPLVLAGADGLVVYQETYDPELYRVLHTAGPKRDFEWRLGCPERAYAAGFRRLGIGALFGLGDWRREAIALAAHAEYLLRHCWKSQLTISLPRLRPCAGEFQPLTNFSDRDLVQLVAALRLFLPDVGLVLSTREPASLRDGLFPLGITHASAGSHTEPGGYTGAGSDAVHQTVRGRIQAIAPQSTLRIPADGRQTAATGQFEIADERSPQEIARRLQQLGYEPVWKDWDAALSA